MAGIIDFFTDMGGKPDLSGEFVGLIAKPDCTQQDLLDFFADNNYADVTPADVAKLFDHRNKIRKDFEIPVRSDY